jgi:predicted RNase H-like HicB family nuclease
MGVHGYLPRCAGGDYRGDTREKALLRAEDALESALASDGRTAARGV